MSNGYEEFQRILAEMKRKIEVEKLSDIKDNQGYSIFNDFIFRNDFRRN